MRLNLTLRYFTLRINLTLHLPFRFANCDTVVVMSEMNQTKGLPVDKWIIVLKKDNPTLASIEQSQDVTQEAQ